MALSSGRNKKHRKNGMDHYLLMQALITHVEARVDRRLDEKELERQTQYSYAHLRSVFKEHNGQTLGRYVQRRRISHAAFMLAHTDRSVLEIALSLNFSGPDVFTRAFRREMGLSPSEFRRNPIAVGRMGLTMGVFGPCILDRSTITKEKFMEDAKRMEKTDGNCLLYGVQKVEYKMEELTPFPACLRSVLNYLGQDVDYAFLMGAAGTAFRLRWRKSFWDGGNVDITYIYDDPREGFDRAFRAAGRKYSVLERSGETRKQDFIDLIRPEIDAGRPVIALGIIGPPEACIITGYRNGGETLLGWNFFQDRGEFNGNASIDESGYFTTSAWWENQDTQAVMAVAEEADAAREWKDLLDNALDVLTNTEMTRPGMTDISCGPAAFDSWAKALDDDSQFPKGITLPELFERSMCQGDAMTMIGEGRYYAARFMEQAGEANPRAAAACRQAAELFEKEGALVQKMAEVQSGYGGEQSARALADRETRTKIIKLIDECKKLDIQASEAVREAVNLLD